VWYLVESGGTINKGLSPMYYIIGQEAHTEQTLRLLQKKAHQQLPADSKMARIDVTCYELSFSEDPRC